MSRMPICTGHPEDTCDQAPHGNDPTVPKQTTCVRVSRQPLLLWPHLALLQPTATHEQRVSVSMTFPLEAWTAAPHCFPTCDALPVRGQDVVCMEHSHFQEPHITLIPTHLLPRHTCHCMLRARRYCHPHDHAVRQASQRKASDKATEDCLRGFRALRGEESWAQKGLLEMSCMHAIIQTCCW